MNQAAKGRSRCFYVLPEEKPPRNVRFPARRPRSARYVGEVSWSWSPGHSRSDSLYLSLDTRRRYWLLWLEWADGELSESNLSAYTRRDGLSPVEAAKLLVACWYKGEELEFSDIGGP